MAAATKHRFKDVLARRLTIPSSTTAEAPEAFRVAPEAMEMSFPPLATAFPRLEAGLGTLEIIGSPGILPPPGEEKRAQVCGARAGSRSHSLLTLLSLSEAGDADVPGRVGVPPAERRILRRDLS